MAERKTLTVIGTMSGTSLDGVDAAVLQTDGTQIIGFGDSLYRPYTTREQEILRAALGLWPDEPKVAEAAAVVELAHAELLSQFPPCDLVGFHGQTLAHDPAGGRTHQAGNGQLLAAALGCAVAWDFRSNDVGLGGQGAPLAPAYHHALARYIGAKGPIAFLNLGGVGNVTWVDPSLDMAQPGALLAFDTGPANAPVNDLMQVRLGQSHDIDGALAATGEVSAEVLAQYVRSPYFSKMPPKSLDRNDFADLSSQVAGLSDADAAATLTACVAAGVMLACEHFPTPPSALLVTGGGRLNPVMMEMIAEAVDIPVQPVEDYDLDGDMLEAQAFAFLAARVKYGLPTSFPGTTGVAAAVGGGEISGSTPDQPLTRSALGS